MQVDEQIGALDDVPSQRVGEALRPRAVRVARERAGQVQPIKRRRAKTRHVGRLMRDRDQANAAPL